MIKQESLVLRAGPLGSDLLTCYSELLSGVSVGELCERYAKVDVLAAQELHWKHVTLEELRAFRERRAVRIAEAARRRGRL
jgi:hypothetical protein